MNFPPSLTWTLLAVLPVLLIALGLALRRAKRVQKDAAIQKSSQTGEAPDTRFTFTSIATFVGLSLLLVLATGSLTAYLSLKNTGDELQMGVLIVAAIVTLMTVLFILAAGFSAMNLTEARQPLGLPEGSVRAMIALILIMVFIIFGIYLFRMVGNGSYYLVDRVNSFPSDAQLEKYQIQGGRRPIIETNSAGGYEIWAYTPMTDDGKRLAQQLTTTVGTLVVAVSGFYFGSSATSSGATKHLPDPSGTPKAPFSDPQLDELMEDEDSKQKEIEKLKGTLTPDDPKVKQAEEGLKSIQEQVVARHMEILKKQKTTSIRLKKGQSES